MAPEEELRLVTRQLKEARDNIKRVHVELARKEQLLAVQQAQISGLKKSRAGVVTEAEMKLKLQYTKRSMKAASTRALHDQEKLFRQQIAALRAGEAATQKKKKKDKHLEYPGDRAPVDDHVAALNTIFHECKTSYGKRKLVFKSFLSRKEYDDVREEIEAEGAAREAGRVQRALTAFPKSTVTHRCRLLWQSLVMNKTRTQDQASRAHYVMSTPYLDKGVLRWKQTELTPGNLHIGKAQPLSNKDRDVECCLFGFFVSSRG